MKLDYFIFLIKQIVAAQRTQPTFDYTRQKIFNDIYK